MLAVISNLIISIISEEHEDEGKNGPAEDEERIVCDSVSECGARPPESWWWSIRSVEILKWTTPSRELEQMKGVHSDKEYTASGTQMGITTALWQLQKKQTSVKHKMKGENQAELWQ